jgi:DNA-binding NarL/FixJ family response regulator
MGPIRPITIMAVEHHSSLSDGLVALLSTQSDLKVVAVASGPAEARKQFIERRPDVTLVDVAMPNQIGLQTIRELRSIQNNAIIFALVGYEWDDLAQESIAAGANLFVPKDDIARQLVGLIREHRRAMTER